MISVKNLSKSFGHTVAVNDVSFDVARGEVLGFLGPNGAGKTTTMRILTCYLTADQGEVTVDQSTLTFTPLSWNIEQTVTVTGVPQAGTYVPPPVILYERFTIGVPCVSGLLTVTT